MKTIVISAVNIRKGGTLTILRSCLEYLSELVAKEPYRVVALVHKRELADFPGIEYMEMPDIIQGWGKRLWCEYVTMYRISKELSPVYLWLSLHDTTPRVRADRQAVYCQTSFPFMKSKWQDLRFDYKIVLFSFLTRFAYQINIRKNRRLIVQAEWLREGFSSMFGLDRRKFIVCPPERKPLDVASGVGEKGEFLFLFPATPDCHKNFELIARAVEILEGEKTLPPFKVVFTFRGNENKYAEWVYHKWHHLKSIDFVGFLPRESLYEYYRRADCLLFPSRIETWGLPISEFSGTGKPMLLADLPYAHETAAGSPQVAFFDSERPDDLAGQMKRLLTGNASFLHAIPEREIEPPCAHSWQALFEQLLD